MIYIDPETGKVINPMRDLVGGDPALSAPRIVEPECKESPDGKMPKQPQATDFTEILPVVVDPGRYVLRVKLNSGASILVAEVRCREEAERRELAINQAMIEYRTKRNAWEKEREDEDAAFGGGL